MINFDRNWSILIQKWSILIRKWSILTVKWRSGLENSALWIFLRFNDMNLGKKCSKMLENEELKKKKKRRLKKSKKVRKKVSSGAASSGFSSSFVFWLILQDEIDFLLDCLLVTSISIAFNRLPSCGGIQTV
jgi:hypothetical protein